MNIKAKLKKSPANQFSLAMILTILVIWCGTFLATNRLRDEQLEAAKKRTEIFSVYCTIIGAVVTASLGFRQYKNDKRDKQVLFIAGEFKEFELRPETINVYKMLADEVRDVKLFPDANNPKERVVAVTDDNLQNALTNQPEELESNMDAISGAIRDNFDRFLNHIERFEKMKESGVFAHSDIDPYLSPMIETLKDSDNRINGAITTYLLKQEKEKYKWVKKLLNVKETEKNESSQASELNSEDTHQSSRLESNGSIVASTNLPDKTDEENNRVLAGNGVQSSIEKNGR